MLSIEFVPLLYVAYIYIWFHLNVDLSSTSGIYYLNTSLLFISSIHQPLADQYIRFNSHFYNMIVSRSVLPYINELSWTNIEQCFSKLFVLLSPNH